MSAASPAAASLGGALFVAPSAYPLGGVATWLDYLLPGLAARGWRPLLALACGDHHDAAAYAREHPGLETLEVRNPTGSREGRIRAIAGAIGRTRPAIALGVNIADTYAAVARMRHDRAGAPKVAMTLHGIQPDLVHDAAAYRATLDGVVCTNRLAAALVAAAGAPPQRIHYAPYGVTLPAATGAARAPAPRLRVAFVGRIEEWQKRVSDLCAIVGALERRAVDFELLVAGAGPEEAKLQGALASQRAAGRVQFLGTLDAGALAARVYSSADVLLLTSAWETGPLVAWEAMAHGMAVVSSRYVGSGLEHAMRDGVNALLFAVGDAEGAADCIARLRSPELRAQLAHAGRQLVAERYTHERSIAAWDACLRSIVDAPPLPDAGEPDEVAASGRLDRIAGTRHAETLRRLARRRFRHAAPGGEWPHSYDARPLDDAAFWAQAARLDGGVP